MTTANLPSDDVGASLERFDGVRGQRYGEIILLGVDAATGHQVGSVYNTTGLNGPAGSTDSCPQSLWEQIDPDAVAKEHNALGAIKNGPRLWCLDWVEAMTGTERDFAGLKAHWAAWLAVTDHIRRSGPPAYRSLTSRRDTRFGVDRGSTAYILDDPDDNSWILKSVNLVTQPGQTYEALSGLGNRLSLPPGWAFRAVTLGADLVLTPDNGTAPIIQDDLGNAYDRAGGPFSNYRP
jgi:hypothetical protein